MIKLVQVARAGISIWVFLTMKPFTDSFYYLLVGSI